MMNEPVLAQRVPLPCTVPPGGIAVVLVDGRVAQDGVQGPGPVDSRPWRGQGRRLEAVVFPATTLRLRFDVPDLRSAEGVRLDLAVVLSLRIERPVQLLTDVVRDQACVAQADLSALLRDAVRTGLAIDLGRRSLAQLEANAKLRSWLGTAIEGFLTDEADLLGRSGLAVVGVDAFDLGCPVWDEERQVRETYYLRAALAEARAEGARLLDARLLAQLQEHVPVKEELVDHKERLAGLAEREAEADLKLAHAKETREARLHDWIVSRGSQPSSMRPELWRRDLEEEVRTAPLCDDRRVYVVTRSGRALAFDRASGDPAWPEPPNLGTSPGDGMALAGGWLWIPGHDGVLYGLEPASGTVTRKLPIGGRLSSAPLHAGRYLYISVDVDADTQRLGTGDVVCVDAARGELVRRWEVSDHGLRAQPSIWDQSLYVGDRPGNVFALDVRRRKAEGFAERGGLILAPAAVDSERGQVIVGDGYGRLLALDRSGRERWSTRLGGPIVGRPLLHGGALFVGAGDGRVYVLDPANAKPLHEPFQTRDAVATPPVGWWNLVFAGSNDGYLYALEAESGRCFWQYNSGSPVSVPPAVSPDGRLYVVDSAGHLNALRWCLARYPEGARRAQEADPPRWSEAIELWVMAGEIQAALVAAEGARRLDRIADLAMHLNWYERAARAYEELARRSSDPLKAAVHWAEAADAWEADKRTERADRCRLLDARNRVAPLLRLREANLPLLTLRQPELVQVHLANCTDALARDVVLAYKGHVHRAGERALGTLGPMSERLEEIEVVPTESGSALLQVTVQYTDDSGRPQAPVSLQVRLKVAQPPEVHHHYYGPHVGGDGVMILRGETSGGSRKIRVQSGDDAVELGRPGRGSGTTDPASGTTCSLCGEPLKAGYRYCPGCRRELDGEGTE